MWNLNHLVRFNNSNLNHKIKTFKINNPSKKINKIILCYYPFKIMNNYDKINKIKLNLHEIIIQIIIHKVNFLIQNKIKNNQIGGSNNHNKIKIVMYKLNKINNNNINKQDNFFIYNKTNKMNK